MEKICNYDKCTGCGLCINICPTKSIKFILSSKGFKIPIIDVTKCIDCHLCEKKCPVNNTIFSQRNEFQKAFKAYSLDNENRAHSSSGGLFSEIAQEFFESKGFVSGAVFYDNYRDVKHIVIDDKTQLKYLRKSKYIQSDTTGVYKAIKDLLNINKEVLFVGTPCQCYALKNFLRKDYEHLFVCDFICHGVGSTGLYQKYLQSLVEKQDDIKYVDFRHKIDGKGFYFLVKTHDEELILDYKTKGVPWGFATNLTLRESCMQCIFTKENRYSDLTLSDLPIPGYDEEKEKGVSCVLCNTNKGFSLLQKIQERLNIEEISYQDVVNSSRHLTQGSPYHPRRYSFFKAYQEGNSYEYLESKFLHPQQLSVFTRIKYKLLRLLNKTCLGKF